MHPARSQPLRPHLQHRRLKPPPLPLASSPTPPPPPRKNGSSPHPAPAPPPGSHAAAGPSSAPGLAPCRPMPVSTSTWTLIPRVPGKLVRLGGIPACPLSQPTCSSGPNHRRQPAAPPNSATFLRHQPAHHQNVCAAESSLIQRPPDPRALARVRHAKPLRPGPRQRDRAFLRPMPVRIRLHHRQHLRLCAGRLRHHAVVLREPIFRNAQSSSSPRHPSVRQHRTSSATIGSATRSPIRVTK